MRAPARAHTDIQNDAGKKIGEITSGGFCPSANKPFAMGYVETASSAEGTNVNLSIRGKPVPAQVSKMPFVPTDYYRAQ